MSPINGHGLAVGQHADVVPVHLIIPKRRPAVDARLLDELLEASPFGRREELVARVRVVKRNLARRLGLLLEEGRLLPVAGKFRVVPVEVADAVGRLRVAVPAQVLLDGRGRRACVVCGLGGRAADACARLRSRRRRRGGACERLGRRRRLVAIDATEVSQKMHAVNNTVRLRLHDVLRAHHGARILISVRT